MFLTDMGFFGRSCQVADPSSGVERRGSLTTEFVHFLRENGNIMVLCVARYFYCDCVLWSMDPFESLVVGRLLTKCI